MCLIQCGNLKHKPLWYRWSYFIKTNQECKICLYEKKFTINKIQKVVDDNLPQYEVLKIDFINNRTEILLQCPNSHLPYYTILSNIIKQYGCKQCANEKALISDESRAKAEIRCNHLNFVFLSIEKNSTHRKRHLISYMDKEGYKYKINYSTLFSKKNHSNSKWQNNPYIIDNINLWCKKNRGEYEVISKECKNIKKDKLVFKYNGTLLKNTHSPLFEATFDCFKNQRTVHPYLSCSKSEKMVYDFLLKNNIEFFKEYVFDYFKENQVKPYRFDFYLPSKNTAIECDGTQHYKPVEFFGGEKTFIRTQTRDKIKNRFCEDNKIKLIRIMYKDFINSKYLDILKQNLL